jgi:serine/threonine protein phosphatase PrpC
LVLLQCFLCSHLSRAVAEPEIVEERLVVGEDQFVLIACDGLFDVFTSQEAGVLFLFLFFCCNFLGL